MIIGMSAIEQLTADRKEQFNRFCDYLLETNEKFNITAIRERNDVYLKHFADSLAGADFFSGDKSVLEIGSGGGFPSVPLKIYNPELKFTLVESNAKKCNFLNTLTDVLGFSDFKAENARAEEYIKGNRERYDYVTARAVAASAVLCELTLPYLKVGGTAIFYKNYSEEEIIAAKRAAEKLGCRLKNTVKYTLDGVDGERCLLIIEKEKQTDEKYPRAYNRIIGKPL